MGEVSNPVLRIDHERSADQYVIRLVGEMDLANVDEVRQALTAAIEGEDPAVIVDMSELEFIDSTGIALLVGTLAHNGDGPGPRFIPSRFSAVARVLELTGLAERLPLADATPQ